MPFMLAINAGAHSFEVANPRHYHEWRIWEDVKLPDGKILIPGLLGHATNYVEHPELIADYIVKYAGLVGRENVIAGADCGFSSRASYAPEVHPTVVWPKFRALAEGAALATKQLWNGNPASSSSLQRSLLLALAAWRFPCHETSRQSDARLGQASRPSR